MISNFIRALFGALFVATPTTPPDPPPPLPPVQIIQIAHAEEIPISATSSMSIPEKIRYYAELYDVSATSMQRTITCESNASSTRQSEHLDPTGPNGREDSWGLVQLHLPSHRNVSRAEALDPDFALNFMARETSRPAGRACGRAINNSLKVWTARDNLFLYGYSTQKLRDDRLGRRVPKKKGPAFV